MVYPILAAVAVGLAEGIPLADMISRLEALDPTPGRLQPVALPNGAFLLRDDFKGGEETIDAALDVMKSLPVQRRIIVMGDIEEPAKPQRQIYRRQSELIGQVAMRAIFVTASENVSVRKSAARHGGLSADGISNVRSIRDAVEQLSDLQAGDVVLIKGPPHPAARTHRPGPHGSGRPLRVDLLQCPAHVLRDLSDARSELAGHLGDMNGAAR